MADNFLQGVAARMKRDAFIRPGVGQKRAFKNGAVLELAFSVNHFRLKIARKGLSPSNDYSVNGGKRRRAWGTEVETFRRAFGVPYNAEVVERAYGSFYWVELAWVVDVEQAASHESAA